MPRGGRRPSGAGALEGLVFERVDAAEARARRLMARMAAYTAALYADPASSPCAKEHGVLDGRGEPAGGRVASEDEAPGALDPLLFRPPGGVFLLGVVGEEPVACGGVRPVVHRPGRAELKRIWVEPAWQRQGIARRLLEELEDFARRAGYEELWLETGPRHRAALALYTAAGYRPIERFGDSPPDWEVLAFGKALRPERLEEGRHPPASSAQPAAARTSSGASAP